MTTYSVEGMTCGGCAASVTKAIQASLPGVEVEIDLEAKQVKVSPEGYDAKVQTAVEEAGFQFGGRA